MYFIFNDFTLKKKVVYSHLIEQPILYIASLLSTLLIFFITTFLQLPVANFIRTLFE